MRDRIIEVLARRRFKISGIEYQRKCVMRIVVPEGASSQDIENFARRRAAILMAHRDYDLSIESEREAWRELLDSIEFREPPKHRQFDPTVRLPPGTYQWSDYPHNGSHTPWQYRDGSAPPVPDVPRSYKRNALNLAPPPQKCVL